jgi:hypothetical protein
MVACDHAPPEFIVPCNVDHAGEASRVVVRALNHGSQFGQPPLRSTFTANRPINNTRYSSHVPLIRQVALPVDPLRPVYLSQHFRRKQ